MLVRIADAERSRKAAEERASESDEHAEALSVALDKEKARTAQLESEGWEAAENAVNDMRARLESAETNRAKLQKELAAALEAMAGALELLEDLERREEMVAAVRARTFDQMKRSLGGASATATPAAPPPAPPGLAMPIRSVLPMKSLKESMVEPEPFLDLDLSE
jgi:chromosome segregation ATPase